MSERPRALTADKKLAVARDVATELEKCGYIEKHEVDAHASDIAKCARAYMDGYRLAKELDNRCYWDCSFDMAEVLNGWSYAYERALDKEQKAWAEREGISPTLAVGARVKIASGECGEISGVYEHGAAKYLVKIDGTTDTSRRVINFEDCTPIVEPVS